MKAYAKVNIFLKITGTRGNYHEIASRFMLVKNLYDTIKFEKGDFSTPTIEGKFSCDVQSNIIYKIYKKTVEIFSSNPKLINFFHEYKVVVDKNIPEFAGLGGGSSDAATFLKMLNSELALGLQIDEMAAIGAQIGADIPFFIYGYDSANVTGIGEIVEQFDEEALNLKIITPNIQCDTKKIYTNLREKFLKISESEEINNLLLSSSNDILINFDLEYLNDLYVSASNIYPKLTDYNKTGYFFSGSGSSFFTKDV